MLNSIVESMKGAVVKVVANVTEAVGITHAGLFHQDELLASTILAMYCNEPITIARVLKVPENVADGVIVFDIGFGPFDHHQKGGNGFHSNGVPYAAAGLLWKEFGLAICRRDYPAIAEELWVRIENVFVSHVDAEDNGVSEFNACKVSPTLLKPALVGFAPLWNEDPSGMDDAFEVACAMMYAVFSRLIEREAANIEAAGLGAELVKNSHDGIAIMDRFFPWQNAIMRPAKELESKAKDILFVVFPSNRGGYNVQGVPQDCRTRALRKELPKEWHGAPQEELRKASGVPDAIFCHPAGFMASAETLEGAIALAKAAMAS